MLSQYWDLLKDPTFNYPAIGGGLLMGAMFVYISSASELIMDTYGVSATHFGWLFGMNAAGFVGLTQLNQWLTNRFRILSILRFGAMMQVISAAALFVTGIIIAGLGLTQPNASAIALAFQKRRAGMASALQGSLMFSVGIFGGLLLNLFPLNPVLKIGIALFVLMSLGAYLIWQIDRDLDLDTAE